MLAIGYSTTDNHSLHKHLDQLLRDYLGLQLLRLQFHSSLDFMSLAHWLTNPKLQATIDNLGSSDSINSNTLNIVEHHTAIAVIGDTVIIIHNSRLIDHMLVILMQLPISGPLLFLQLNNDKIIYLYYR